MHSKLRTRSEIRSRRIAGPIPHRAIFALVTLAFPRRICEYCEKGTTGSNSEEVSKHRRAAAEFTRGIRSDSIYSAIRQLILDLSGKVLDFGAGVGQLTQGLLSMQRFEQISAADIMPAPPALAGKIEWIEQDLNLPIENHDEAFDVVISAEVIEHLENPRAMMRELYRLVRPGGTVIVTTRTTRAGALCSLFYFEGTSFCSEITRIPRTSSRYSAKTSRESSAKGNFTRRSSDLTTTAACRGCRA